MVLRPLPGSNGARAVSRPAMSAFGLNRRLMASILPGCKRGPHLDALARRRAFLRFDRPSHRISGEAQKIGCLCEQFLDRIGCILRDEIVG